MEGWFKRGRTGGPAAPVARPLRPDRGSPLALALALLVYAGAAFCLPVRIALDEAHYSALGLSLATEGDVDPVDDYLALSGPGGWPGMPSQGGWHVVPRAGGDGSVSRHGVGLPVLLAPVLAAGGGLVATRGLMVGISAIFAWLAWYLLASPALGLARREIWGLWILVAACPVALQYSSRIMTEMPTAAVATGVLAVLARPDARAGARWAAAFAVAFLPWLHPRVSVLGAVLALALFVAERRRLTPWPTALARSLGPSCVAAAVLLICHQVWYGIPLPQAGYVVARQPLEGLFTWEPFRRNVLGSFFSPGFGWLPFAPAHLIGLVGLGAWWLRARPGPRVLALLGVVAALVPLGASAAVGVGIAYPGRLLVGVLLPVLPWGLGWAWRRAPVARLLVVALASWLLALGAASLARPDRFVTWSSEVAAEPLIVGTAALWPSFAFGETRGATDGRWAAVDRDLVVPWEEQGGKSVTCARTPPAPGWRGLFAHGPRGLELLAGRYRARVELLGLPVATTGAPPAASEAVTLTLRSGRDAVATRRIATSDLPAPGELRRFDLEFALATARYASVEVGRRAEVAMAVCSIRIEPVGVPSTSPPAGRRASDVLLAAWLVALALGSWGLARRDAADAG